MDTGEVIKTSDDGTMRVRLAPDNDARNPREEYDHAASVIVRWYRPYDEGEQEQGPLLHAWEHYARRYRVSAAMEMFRTYAIAFHGATVKEHQLSRDAWALWYITAETAAKEGITDPGACLDAEMSEYQAYLDGDVYGYIIERRVTWSPVDDEDEYRTMETWDEVESCWGYYGCDYAVEAAIEAFNNNVTAP